MRKVFFSKKKPRKKKCVCSFLLFEAKKRKREKKKIRREKKTTMVKCINCGKKNLAFIQFNVSLFKKRIRSCEACVPELLSHLHVMDGQLPYLTQTFPSGYKSIFKFFTEVKKQHITILSHECDEKKEEECLKKECMTKKCLQTEEDTKKEVVYHCLQQKQNHSSYVEEEKKQQQIHVGVCFDFNWSPVLRDMWLDRCFLNFTNLESFLNKKIHSILQPKQQLWFIWQHTISSSFHTDIVVDDALPALKNLQETDREYNLALKHEKQSVIQNIVKSLATKVFQHCQKDVSREPWNKIPMAVSMKSSSAQNRQHCKITIDELTFFQNNNNDRLIMWQNINEFKRCFAKECTKRDYIMQKLKWIPKASFARLLRKHADRKREKWRKAESQLTQFNQIVQFLS